jgi:hypothetical protein
MSRTTFSGWARVAAEAAHLVRADVTPAIGVFGVGPNVVGREATPWACPALVIRVRV